MSSRAGTGEVPLRCIQTLQQIYQRRNKVARHSASLVHQLYMMFVTSYSDAATSLVFSNY